MIRRNTAGAIGRKIITTFPPHRGRAARGPLGNWRALGAQEKAKQCEADGGPDRPRVVVRYLVQVQPQTRRIVPLDSGKLVLTMGSTLIWGNIVAHSRRAISIPRAGRDRSVAGRQFFIANAVLNYSASCAWLACGCSCWLLRQRGPRRHGDLLMMASS